MKTSTNLMIWSFIWIALAVVGLVFDSDSVYVVGLVGSIVNTTGNHIARLIEKKESK